MKTILSHRNKANNFPIEISKLLAIAIGTGMAWLVPSVSPSFAQTCNAFGCSPSREALPAPPLVVPRLVLPLNATPLVAQILVLVNAAPLVVLLLHPVALLITEILKPKIVN